MSSPLQKGNGAAASSANHKKAQKRTKKAKGTAAAAAVPARNTSDWHVNCSAMASRIENPIRAISDKAGSMAAGGDSDKPLIKLSVGDPTLDKNFFGAPQRHVDAVKAALDSHDFDGYVPATGTPEARQAVVDFWVKNFVSHSADGAAARARKVASIPKEHVVLTSGGSHAIQLAITSICGPGDNVLLPTPCFPHYITICDTFKVKKKFYKLDPKKHWEVNLEQVEQQCDANTKLMVITNPSNPCGSNYRRRHVEDILKLAERLKLPVFSDEIYAGMVFQKEKAAPPQSGQQEASSGKSEKQQQEEEQHQKQKKKQRYVFTSVVDFNTSVPRVVLGGTAKQFAVPGWRLGWLIYAGNSSLDEHPSHDGKAVESGQKHPSETGDNLLYGIEQQALLIVGPTALAQGALPSFLSSYSTSMVARPAKTAEELSRETQEEKDEAFFYRFVSQIERCARTFVTSLNSRCQVPAPANDETADGAKEKEKKKKKPHYMVYAMMPQGAMYVMMKVNTKYFRQDVVSDEYSFFENLLKEEHVQLVPGGAFRRPGYLRVVITRPESVLLEAVDRIAAFCHRYYDPEEAGRRESKKSKAKKGKTKGKTNGKSSAQAHEVEDVPVTVASDARAAEEDGKATVEAEERHEDPEKSIQEETAEAHADGL